MYIDRSIKSGVLILLFLLCNTLAAQNMSGIIKDSNPFAINGYINTQFTSNAINGIERRQDPFNYRINSMISVKSYGWRTSINLNIADRREVYSVNLPQIKIPSYALIGISPTYKWATFHMGFRNMHFSDYSLAGHSFYGSGVDLSPGNFRFSSFYGRLKRASIENIGLRQSLDPSYKRMGWGFKIGYEKDQQHIAVSLFNAFDVKGSLPDEGINATVSPKENSVIGITATKKIGNILTLDIDYAFSALARDSRAEPIENYQGILHPLQSVFGIFKPRQGSEYNKALKTKVSFKVSSGAFNITHERVDPGYRSLGSLFFNNDFENITAGGQLKTTDNKVMLTANAGFQRNNITGDESNGLRRFIGAINAQFNYSVNSNIRFSYSNFRTTNTLYAATIPIIQVDSITLSLVNQQFSVSFQKFSGENKSSGLFAMISYNRSHAIENDIVQSHQTNKNLMAHVSYNKKVGSESWNLTGGFLMNRNSNPINSILLISPFIGATKAIVNNNLYMKSFVSVVNVYSDNTYQRMILHPRVNISYRLNNKHSLDFTTYITSQIINSSATNSFTELSSRISWKARL